MVGMLQKGASIAPWRWELQGTGCKGTPCGAINPLKNDNRQPIKPIKNIRVFSFWPATKSALRSQSILVPKLRGIAFLKTKTIMTSMLDEGQRNLATFVSVVSSSYLDIT